MARSTRLVMRIKNIYTLWGRKRLLHCLQTFDWNHNTLCKGINISYHINITCFIYLYSNFKLLQSLLAIKHYEPIRAFLPSYCYCLNLNWYRPTIAVKSRNLVYKKQLKNKKNNVLKLKTFGHRNEWTPNITFL